MEMRAETRGLWCNTANNNAYCLSARKKYDYTEVQAIPAIL
jgi:hypothetical protein